MRILAIVTLLFTAGAMLLHFFVLVSGIRESGVVRGFYWIRVNTNGIENAQPVTDWYIYNTCSSDGTINSIGNTIGCGSSKPAFPFSPYDNFNHTTTVPGDFIQHRDKFYYMSRFLMPFFLIALFFETCILFLQFFAVCSHKLGIVCSVISFVGWLFATTAASLATACFVIGRKTFQNAGYEAKVGVKMFAFVWTAMFLSTCVTFMLPYISNRGNKSATVSGDPMFESSSAHFGNNTGVYKFGFGTRKTTEGGVANAGPDNDASSFVRAV